MTKITNPKHGKNMTPKCPMTVFWSFEFGTWNLFDIWCLNFGI